MIISHNHLHRMVWNQMISETNQVHGADCIPPMQKNLQFVGKYLCEIFEYVFVSIFLHTLYRTLVRGHLVKIQEIDSPQKFTLATSLIQTGVEHDTIQIFNCGGLFMRENRDILFKFVTTVPVHSIFW